MNAEQDEEFYISERMAELLSLGEGWDEESARKEAKREWDKEVHCSAMGFLASELDVPVDHIAQAVDGLRTVKMKESLMEKVRIIRSGNTAILPTGEIVERGSSENAMPYETLNP